MRSLEVRCAQGHKPAGVATIAQPFDHIGDYHVEIWWGTTDRGPSQPATEHKRSDDAWWNPRTKTNTYSLTCHRCGLNLQLSQAVLDVKAGLLLEHGVASVELSSLVATLT